MQPPGPVVLYQECPVSSLLSADRLLQQLEPALGLLLLLELVVDIALHFMSRPPFPKPTSIQDTVHYIGESGNHCNKVELHSPPLQLLCCLPTSSPGLLGTGSPAILIGHAQHNMVLLQKSCMFANFSFWCHAPF